MSKKPFYITTPIYYPSDRLHIGHAYCTTIADSIARYKRLAGFDVLFLTGSDEHGQKIQRKAEENHTTPQAYVDNIVASFKNLWEKLDISNDDFIRTTERRHQELVQAVFQKIYDQGDIYKAEYEGWYCTPCETFWLERQLVDGKCPDCGRPVEILKEESYFFRMSKYQDRLLQFIEENPDFIQPTSRRNEMINFIKGGLEDLCVSRTTFDWGIPVPFDTKHVVYVWFDALTNYITAAGYLNDREKFAKYWPADIHLVGKEIVRFHSIIWPVILMALGVELPKKVYGHGWLVVEGDKMSKSKGNVIDPIALIDEFGADAIRYYLLREITLGLDGNFSREALINRINADLANDLGNLLHRSLSMIGRFNDGVVEAPGEPSAIDQELIELARTTAARYEQDMEHQDINIALKELWALVGRTNKYIDETGPWALAKDPAKKGRLHTVLYNLAEVLRIVAILISPFMPQTSPKIWRQLGLKADFAGVSLHDAQAWGRLPVGTVVAKPEPIFPRIEEKPAAVPAAQTTAAPAQPPEAAATSSLPEITIDEFAKIDLRVVKVLAAEKVKKADKLLLLTVDLGTEQRTIISGIAKHYEPEQLIGQNVVMVVNLKPAKIRGIESRGMVLAASCDDKLRLVTADMPPGSKVK
ncbi:methionine--tRNA ligase [Sporomusa acidovorans]|uniref:Methionine--tRNA ligase n=1 Tax=Sporomusa acidovorans (strain ATCC 49682 / DSM 3132 / Mol) TaxID=1123286 RepID=A0ABZ3IWL8_SPOA4|nr:methionine--tRNA ligase [Sporomusa acidovorans]OZC14004.1 methionine--tRNA ligase [Sporomusa acidovorans DSM 3132]SDF22191.1 methionyl-tRNA synthetase [Sporomusa acidovorans]